MNSLLPTLAVLVLASLFGVWHTYRSGKVKSSLQKGPEPHISPAVIGIDLGSRVTLVQFSSAFCTPCRATKVLLQEITKDMDDVVHVDIDAESHLDLIRELDIRSTPTTLIIDKHGFEVGRAVGAARKDAVLAAIEAVQ